MRCNHTYPVLDGSVVPVFNRVSNPSRGGRGIGWKLDPTNGYGPDSVFTGCLWNAFGRFLERAGSRHRLFARD